MKIISVSSLAIPEIKIVRFARFCDHRGYFSEPFRKSDFSHHPDMKCFEGVEFVQANESYSQAHVIRGLHFQWNPYMGKLVRTLSGRMIDLVMDIRLGSPTFGKIIAYDLPVDVVRDYSEWIWVPPGFAHGNFFTEPTLIEYFCSGEYSPGCEAGISPFSSDLDWSLCTPDLATLFEGLKSNPEVLISGKDRDGVTLSAWQSDERAQQFIYGQV